MDGRGRALDNIFVGRLWRSVKYENVYLKGYETIPDAEAGLKEYFEFYNLNRKRQSLGYKTPTSRRFVKTAFPFFMRLFCYRYNTIMIIQVAIIATFTK